MLYKMFYIIFFLNLIINFTLNKNLVKSSLYSDFNKKIDELSNYAQQKSNAEYSPSFDGIYKNSQKLFNENLKENRIKNEDNEWNLDDNLYEIQAIKKLMDAFNLHNEPFDKNVMTNRFNKKKLKNPFIIDKNEKYAIKAPQKRNDWNMYPTSTFGITGALNPLPQLYPNIVTNPPTINVQSFNPLPQAQDLNKDYLGKQIQEIQRNILPNLQPQVKDLTKLSLPQTPTSNTVHTNVNQNKISNPYNNPNSNDIATSNLNLYNASIENFKHMNFDCNNPTNDSSNMLPTTNNDNQHLTNILDKVLNELQAIRQCKAENKTHNGYPCDITGSWNSEIIGLKFDISPTNDGKEFPIQIKDRYPKRVNRMIQLDWKCSGSVMRTVGGPFFMVAKKCEENTIATFSGLCRICGGIDMIFGAWTFVKPARSCEDVQIAIETCRDVLRRSVLVERKRKRLEEMRKHTKINRSVQK